MEDQYQATRGHQQRELEVAKPLRVSERANSLRTDRRHPGAKQTKAIGAIGIARAIGGQSSTGRARAAVSLSLFHGYLRGKPSPQASAHKTRLKQKNHEIRRNPHRFGGELP